MSLFDSIYANAAALTGRSEPELRKTAEQVFAVMLFHAAAQMGKPVITSIVLDANRLEVEVNTFSRKPTAITLSQHEGTDALDHHQFSKQPSLT